MMKTTTATELANRLPTDVGGAVYAVGGSVRDMLLGREGADLDVAAEDAAGWAEATAAALGSHLVRLGGEHRLWRIPHQDSQIDVVQLRGDIEADLRRRDFRIDAMALPLSNFLRDDLEALIDPLGGRADLEARRLRLASPDALRDDPLRLLRAARLEMELGCAPTAETLSAMRFAAPKLPVVAPERIAAELQLIFAADLGSGEGAAASAVERLEAVGALGLIFPELDVCRGVDQRPLHRRDVFGHQIDAALWIDRLIADQPPSDPTATSLWRELWQGGGLPGARSTLYEHRATLRLATLLHDIGKPATRKVTVEPDGARTSFHGHSELGAELARERLTALRFPNRLIDQVALLIEQHLRPGQVASPGKPPTARALRRFHLALSDAAAPLCWLFLADSLATVGAETLAPRWPAYVAHVGCILAWRPRRPATAPRLLNGKQIMAAAGIASGPLVGQIRDQIDEAAALGVITTADQARDLARRLASQSAAQSASQAKATQS